MPLLRLYDVVINLSIVLVIDMEEQNKLYKKLYEEFNLILTEGQAKTSFKKFKQRSPSYPKVSAQIFLPLFIVLVLFSMAHYYVYPFIDPGSQGEIVKLSFNIFFEGCKVLLGALSIFIVTIFLTHRWQQRVNSFNMLQELNSDEFLITRNDLGNQIIKARKENKDVEDLNGWFPYNNHFVDRIVDPSKDSECSIEIFKQTHALANMLYFILRLVNYYKFDMLNKRLTRHLFHFFFCHYELLMLEFACKLREYKCELQTEGYNYDERWDLIADDIEMFFKIIGLSGALNDNHIFVYFPSLNR